MGKDTNLLRRERRRMKIKTTVTQIECNAEELRQSNTVSDGLLNAMRRAFNGPIFNTAASYTEPEEESEEEE